MNNTECDVLVLGSGPGGYVAAVRAAELGLKTVCVERAELGGVCLNWGCIPTKALLRSAEYKRMISRAAEFGINIESDVTVDFRKVVERSREVSARMSNGIAFLFKKNKVVTINGTGKIVANNQVEVSDKDGNVTDTVSCKNIIIATGARPRMFKDIDVDHEKIITSREALVQSKIPESMVIMGAGAIGIEFAYFFSSFGTKVTVIEMMDRILPIEDKDVSAELARGYRKLGIKTLTSTRVLSAKTIGENVEVKIQKKDGTEEVLTCDIALNAIGVQANIENIGLEELGINTERGRIVVDEFCRTNVEGIYAIGDIGRVPALAHKASAEGRIVAEYIAGKNPKPVDYTRIPGCTFSSPQVASIGLTEEKAKAAGFEVKVGKFSFMASGKAHGMGEANGFVKLVFDASDGKLLGGHLIGPEVTEMIGEIALALDKGVTAFDIAETIHAHPTLGEGIMEAAAAVRNELINK